MRATEWRILLGVVLFFTAVVGCSSKDEAVLTEACNLYRGMTREQVREIMGQPNLSESSWGSNAPGGFDTWVFDSNNKSIPRSNLSDKVAWRIDVYYQKNNEVSFASLSPDLCLQK